MDILLEAHLNIGLPEQSRELFCKLYSYTYNLKKGMVSVMLAIELFINLLKLVTAVIVLVKAIISHTNSKK